jgi:hypothetical protein
MKFFFGTFTSKPIEENIIYISLPDNSFNLKRTILFPPVLPNIYYREPGTRAIPWPFPFVVCNI